MMDVIERARGQWHLILPRLGIDLRFLRRTLGPCPICGGRSRFRFVDRIGYGDWHCRQCGPGDGFLLLRKVHGWSADEARDNVDDIVGPEPVWSERTANTYRMREALCAHSGRAISISTIGARHVLIAEWPGGIRDG